MVELVTLVTLMDPRQVGDGGGPPAETFYILLQDGDRVLLQNGDGILTQDAP